MAYHICMRKASTMALFLSEQCSINDVQKDKSMYNLLILGIKVTLLLVNVVGEI